MIRTMSRSEAEHFWFEPHHALISIREMGYDTPKLHGNPGEVLFLEFDDTEPQSMMRDVDVLYTEEQAAKVARFVRRNSERELLIHCLAGISRSVGMASAIEAWRGGDWETVERGKCPNSYVRKLTREALESRPASKAEGEAERG